MGSLAAYYGGWVDTLISRIMEIFAAFPDLIFAMAIMYVLGAGMKNIFVALGLLTWVRTARMIRGSILQLKEKEYVEAAKASGAIPVLYYYKTSDSELYFNNHRTCNIRYSECNYV